MLGNLAVSNVCIMLFPQLGYRSSIEIFSINTYFGTLTEYQLDYLSVISSISIIVYFTYSAILCAISVSKHFCFR